jgi:hypothetical protein
MNWIKSLNWLNKYKRTYIYSIFIMLIYFSLYKWVCKQAGALSELPWAA